MYYDNHNVGTCYLQVSNLKRAFGQCLYFNLHLIFRFCLYTSFVQNVSRLTTVHEVDKDYGVLTLIVFNTVPFRSYTLRPTLLSLLETFCELFRDV